MLQSKKLVVKKVSNNNNRLDTICVEMLSDFSRKKIKSIIDNGGAYVNKKRVKIAKYEIKANDIIELFWDDNQKAQNTLTEKNIVFENDDFIILDKPAGIPVQATLNTDTNTILHALQKMDKKKYPLELLHLVHRLDKETSGLMIIAKNADAQKSFENMFREHKITKTYRAICFFTPKLKSGIIRYPIAKDSSRQNTYFAVTTDKAYPGQKTAETEYTIEKLLPHGSALVVCHPKTGRTHQIRVHLLSIGCPIIGDKTYAQNVYGHPYARTALRQLLHASELKFTFKEKEYDFSSNLPKDFDFALTGK